MDTSWLVGKTIKVVWTYATGPVHPAWVNELTTPIATSSAFLELESGEFLQVAPCEVQLEGETYPSLGLELELRSRASARVTLPSGIAIDVLPLPDAAKAVPLDVVRVEESDPLGEGTVSQFNVIGALGQALTFRHIMSPMTLGILVAAPGPST